MIYSSHCSQLVAEFEAEVVGVLGGQLAGVEVLVGSNVPVFVDLVGNFLMSFPVFAGDESRLQSAGLVELVVESTSDGQGLALESLGTFFVVVDSLVGVVDLVLMEVVASESEPLELVIKTEEVVSAFFGLVNGLEELLGEVL